MGCEMDAVARDVAAYFRKYNYRITAEGATVAFTGAYEASRGTAAATTFYFFIGLACIALVLQTIVPRVGPFEIGNGWYALTLLSPLAWTYYFRTGDREETVKMRMEGSDDAALIDLIVEGDKGELEAWKGSSGSCRRARSTSRASSSSRERPAGREWLAQTAVPSDLVLNHLRVQIRAPLARPPQRFFRSGPPRPSPPKK